MEREPSTRVLAVLAVILLAVGLGLTVYAINRPDRNLKSANQASRSSGGDKTADTTPTSKAITGTSDSPTIVFTDDGFSQDSYTFPAGVAIKVVNQSSMDMQFSSDDHPTHRDHPELNMNVLGAGESGSFTPKGAGTYKFHDHINDQYEGILVIQ